MRIGFLVSEFPSVSETFIRNQVTSLVQLGHEVDVYADFAESGAATERVNGDLLGVRIFRIPRFSRDLVQRLFEGARTIVLTDSRRRLLLRALNVLRFGAAAASLRLLYDAVPFSGSKMRYDAMICHFGPNGLRGLRLREIGAYSGPLVTVFHGYDLTSLIAGRRSGIYNRLFRNGDLFLPISERWRDRLEELGCPPERIHVHHMGIDCKQFGYHDRTIRDGEPIRFVSVARLVEKKGIEYGIRAVASLLREGADVEYRIVGDGPLREQCLEVINELGVGDRIRLLGSKTSREVCSILQDCHVLLAPSVTAVDGDQEGIPVALMEAMASGLLVVSTYHSGIPELITEGVTGFLVPERDVEALAARLRAATSVPTAWKPIARAARTIVERDFETGRLSRQLIQLIEVTQARGNRFKTEKVLSEF